MTLVFENEYMDMVEAVVDNKLSHLYAQFDYVMMEHAENLLEIEHKILCESGTEDDMYELYAFEAEDTKAKGQGFLAKICATIKDLFRKIKDFFTKSKNVDENSLPDEIKLNDNPDEVIKETKGLIGGIKSFFGGNKGALKKLGVVAITATVSTGAIIIGKKKVKPLINELESLAKSVESEMAAAEGKVADTSLSPEEQKEARGALALLQKAGNKINTIRKGLFIKNNENYKIGKELENAKNLDGKDKKTRDEEIDKRKQALHDDVKAFSKKEKQSKDDKLKRREDISNAKQTSKELKSQSAKNDAVIGAKNELRNSSQELAGYQQRLAGVVEELRDATHELEKLQSGTKNIFGGDARWYKELQALEKIPTRKMTDKQLDRYNKLSDKYDNSNKKSKEIDNVKKHIAKLVKQRDQLQKNIENEEKRIADKKRKVVDAKRGR